MDLDRLNGRPQNSFLGWANYILDRAKGYFNTFQYQINSYSSYVYILYLKTHKCQIPVPGKSLLVLPIGADAHAHGDVCHGTF